MTPTQLPAVTDFATTAQNFLTNKEKSAGALFTTVCAIGALVGLWSIKSTILSILSFAAALVGGTIAVGVTAVVAIWFIMLLMNPRTYTELYHLQARTAAWVSAWAIKQDPFGRLRAFADEYLQAQFDKFNNAAVKLEAQLLDTRAQISKAQDSLRASNEMCNELQRRYCDTDGNWDTEQHQSTFRLEAQRITQTEGMLARRQKAEQRLSMMVKIMDRWRNTFKFEIESTRMTAQFLEDDYNAANNEATALEAASSAFGQGEMAKADQEARAYIEKLTQTRIAQADVLLKQIPELTAVGELKGDMAEDAIMARLRDFDKQSQRVLIDVQEDRRMLTQGAPAEAIKAKVQAPVLRKTYLK